MTDGSGIVPRAPSRAISPPLVPAITGEITGTSALILIVISASGQVLTNVTVTTATGNDASHTIQRRRSGSRLKRMTAGQP